jgi:hypothetical protein
MGIEPFSKSGIKARLPVVARGPKALDHVARQPKGDPNPYWPRVWISALYSEFPGKRFGENFHSWTKTGEIGCAQFADFALVIGQRFANSQVV